MPVCGTTDEFQYLTLTCHRDLLMTRVSLASLARKATRLPKLIIAHDESLTTDEARSYFSDWPEEVDFYSRLATEHHFEEIGEPHIAEFCRRHIFGFKLAACLLASENGRVLYSDADVLWFGDCFELMTCRNSMPLYGSSDLGFSFDQQLVGRLPAPLQESIYESPGVCAGFAIYNSKIIQQPLLHVLTRAILDEQLIGRFAEQTIVAALVCLIGEKLPGDFVRMLPTDFAKLRSSHQNTVAFACHYPDSLRPQFWIDRVLSH
jgi:hypothetical protein